MRKPGIKEAKKWGRGGVRKGEKIKKRERNKEKDEIR